VYKMRKKTHSQDRKLVC